MKKQVERERGAEEAAHYDFFPTTFILPSEYQMFVEEFKRSSQVGVVEQHANAFVAYGDIFFMCSTRALPFIFHQ